MNPVLTPTSTDITDSTPDQVEAAVAAAHGAATAWAATPAADRARALTQVADVLDAHGEELIDLAAEESHLPLGRLRGELVRTTFQLRYLGEYVAAGRHLDPIIDHADPNWPMGAPRPDLRRTHLPLVLSSTSRRATSRSHSASRAETRPRRWLRGARWWSRSIPAIRGSRYASATS